MDFWFYIVFNLIYLGLNYMFNWYVSVCDDYFFHPIYKNEGRLSNRYNPLKLLQPKLDTITIYKGRFIAGLLH